jgi:hypothetical protein
MSIPTDCGSSKESNDKTLLSFDLTTICPKAARGDACAYCHVKAEREMGARPKKAKPYAPYVGHRWPLALAFPIKNQLSAMGGVRMFGSSDYYARHRKDVEQFLADCLIAGVKAKAITKRELFLVHHHDHEAIAVVNVSIDRLGSEWGRWRSQITEERARALKELYHKVRIRAVCLSREDLEYYGSKPYIDILALNHARNAFHRFRPTAVKEAADRWPGRVCGEGMACCQCLIKCGAG